MLALNIVAGGKSSSSDLSSSSLIFSVQLSLVLPEIFGDDLFHSTIFQWAALSLTSGLQDQL